MPMTPAMNHLFHEEVQSLPHARKLQRSQCVAPAERSLNKQTPMDESNPVVANPTAATGYERRFPTPRAMRPLLSPLQTNAMSRVTNSDLHF
jgi:hypothetical protein